MFESLPPSKELEMNDDSSVLITGGGSAGRKCPNAKQLQSDGIARQVQ